ncbi:MAG: UvrD-helicase domain-containing protein, partial [Lachnospiraceae bacterium]|nr:UvrD-helicase domain-containing protein [Lachnospiraceae bacterium]
MIEGLNENQRLGVETTEGPVLILAGAGSGKTRVLTHRIAYLMKEKGVAPYHILAITFTNKAAQEMRNRVNKLAGDGAEMVWVATFHSTCVRILRRFADHIGFDNRFTIFDTEDQKTVMKEVIHELGIDPKMFRERFFLNYISAAKNELITAEQYHQYASGGRYGDLIERAYKEYQNHLYSYNGMDFDDLLMNTVELLRMDPEVLSYYQKRFSYILVDEYQDTNTAQFAFIELLAKEHHNICVVGDDDQSIYRFRGANIRNILDFEDHYPEAKVIRLEQNYRSVQAILDVANSVIAHNAGRKEKSLWTENGNGDPVVYRQFDSAYREAEFVVNDIAANHLKGRCDYRDCAVLYRTNAQSRLLEEKFLMASVPYRIIGGVNFYGRKEIKDILAYLRTIDNPRDDVSARRIINIPRRGIGQTTVGRLSEFAIRHEIGFYQALERLSEIPDIGRSKKKLQDFWQMIEALKVAAEHLSVSKLMKKILEETGYEEELRKEDTVEARTRLENIDELLTKAVTFEEEFAKSSQETGDERSMLSAFLEDVALVSDTDRMEEEDNFVTLMTLHSAKGLEFENVYLTGLEEGLFPSSQSINSDTPDEEVEEERRLCYVGITRAKKR